MKSLFFAIVAATLLVGCGNGGDSFSLLKANLTFQQVSSTINTKVDVLWVVDNSGSMASSQDNLAANFPSFINQFSQKGYDYQIAVTISDAYLALPAWTSYYNQTPRPSYYEGLAQSFRARFRDGVGTTHSGVYVIKPDTPDLLNVFVKNIRQGTAGHGDERVIQSFRAALDSPHNAGFVRPGGHLAVILLTDEDDFSHNNPGYLEGQYNNPALHTIGSYVSYLEGLTGSSGPARRFSVNSLAIHDEACRQQLFNGAQKIALRVGQLVDATNGKKASLCNDFATELSQLAQNIVQLSTQFFLSVRPIVETIQIIINGNVIPQAANNPNNDGGWTYDANANSIVFTGNNYIPPQGASINVSFDPDGLQF